MGFSTMHLYLPICSQARLGRMIFAPERLRREPLWVQWYLGLGREMALHSMCTSEPILADKMPFKMMWLVLSCTLSGPSAETRQKSQNRVSDPSGSCLLPSTRMQPPPPPPTSRCPHSAPQTSPRANTYKAAVPKTTIMFSVTCTYYEPAL